ncbi:MAG: adenine nucleotide alpha hydrolase family protein [Spirochaetes bacterium]|nr:adenine nucleotide alpha hydrolase family protein [Spirochaetota bacterium]
MVKNCQYCNNPAVYHRKISNEFVCIKHFCVTIENKIRKAVRKYDMFNPQEKVVVGVSGGKDSLVLLYNVLKLQNRNPKAPPIEAILIDEGIQGYRNESVEIAKEMCQKWHVPLHIVPFDAYFGATLDNAVKDSKHLNINACTICGTVRRRLLNDQARLLRADKLAIGHNLDDITETFIQNIVRNDLKKLTSKPPYGNFPDPNQKLVPRVKPLMNIPEVEITRYCYYKKIPIQTTPCPYVENFFILRQKVQKFINELEENSAEVKYNLLTMNERLFSILNNNVKMVDILSTQKSNVIKKNKYTGDFCQVCGEPKGINREICYYCELKQQLGLKNNNDSNLS